MNNSASPDTLARQHLAALSQADASRSLRQRLRLALLKQAGRRYAAGHLVPLPPSPQRILVIRPDHLGDLLFATPALHLLRRQWPDAHITALVGPWGEAVLANNPDVDQVLTCAFPGFTRQAKGSPLAPYRLLQAEAERLRAFRFDQALILRFDHWWGAWLAAAAGIPHRTGYDIAETRPLLTQPVAYVHGRHEVVQNLALALAAGDQAPVTGDRLSVIAQRLVDGAGGSGNDWRLRFAVREADEAAATRLLPPAFNGPVVAIHPGSGAAVKRWRTEAWVELATELSRWRDAQIVFTGAAGEAELIEPVLAALRPEVLPRRPISLAGQTTLGTLAAVYKRCDLVIGPDSGPLHLAVAVGAPTVHLYGPVDRRTFGPWGSPSRHRVVISGWACIPCNRLDWPDSALREHGCVRDIGVGQVLSEVDRLLQTPGSASPPEAQ